MQYAESTYEPGRVSAGTVTTPDQRPPARLVAVPGGSWGVPERSGNRSTTSGDEISGDAQPPTGVTSSVVPARTVVPGATCRRRKVVTFTATFGYMNMVRVLA